MSKKQRNDVTLCEVQFIIDNINKTYKYISSHTGLYNKTIWRIANDLGLKVTPEEVIQEAAKQSNYEIFATAELLEEWGHGGLNMRNVREICNASKLEVS